MHPVSGGKILRFYVNTTTTSWKSVTFDLSGISGFDLTEWHHYAGTFDAASGALKLYIDGQLRAQDDIGESLTLTGSADPTYIGFDDAGTNRYFNGQLDEAAIYGSVLTDSQLAEHYLASEVIPEPATLCVLALGGLAVLRRRRKKQDR
jgi:hypothetical protein